MKLLCPGCSKNVEVPESALGTEYPCLVCGTKIPVPKTYTPSVAVPPPPPSSAAAPAAVNPPAPPGLAPASSTPPALPATSGDMSEVGVTITPSVLSWVTPIALTLAFLLTFFTWVGAYPGGHKLFGQTAWKAMSGDITPNTVGIAKLDSTEKELEKVIVYSKWLIPYLFLLVVTVVFAWAERFVPDLTPTSVTGAFAWILPIWPMRFRLLTILCGVLLFLFLLQSWRGFGLENAILDHAAQQHADAAKAADTQAKRDTVTVQQGLEVAQYAVQSTNWYWLALFANIAAVLGMAGRSWYARRGSKPPARVLLRY
jgi:hypothetical protein